jgi:hypothetical protein
MRVEPELDEIVNGDRGMLRGIEVALDAQCLVSAVALIFSTVDALSALTRPVEKDDTDKSVFIEWTSRYLAPEKTVGCSATDFYAARCGVLHTYSADSRLGREAKARRLIYEWESGPSADEVTPLPDGAIVIRVEPLHRALREAVYRFLIAAETERDTKQKVLHHLPSMLCYKPWSRLEAVVAA